LLTATTTKQEEPKERRTPYNCARLQYILEASTLSWKVGPYHGRIVIMESEPIVANMFFGITPPPLHNFMIALEALGHAVRTG